MNQAEVVKIVLKNKSFTSAQESAEAFAPSNIALVKYWGKRDKELNLPITSSLSIGLGNKGAVTSVSYHQDNHDKIYLNNNPLSLTATFSQRFLKFLDLFRPNKKTFFQINTNCNIPIAAGLASSACSYASLVCALNKFYQWQLNREELSILARLGSGSACRSLWQGFVEWQQGEGNNGFDSHGIPLPHIWPELRLGLLIFHSEPKSISSREAMQHTVETSTLYPSWRDIAKTDLKQIKRAISEKNFTLLGETAENNALAMHGTMMTAKPPIMYSLPDTISTMQKIWKLRKEGIEIYFTQDAGPNLKLLFLENALSKVLEAFPNIDIVEPFSVKDKEHLIENADKVSLCCGKEQ